MTSRFRPAGTLLLKLVGTGAITWLILRGIVGVSLADVGAVEWRGVVDTDIPLLALSVALLLVAFSLGAWFWSRLLVDFGGPAIPLPTVASMVFVSNMGRYVPGKILHLAGLVLLVRRRGISGTLAVGSAVAGQILHLLGAAFVGGWTASRLARVPPGWSIAAGVALFLGLAAFVRFGGLQSILAWTLRRRGEPGEPTSPEGKRLLRWLSAYTSNWFVYGLAFFFLGRGLGMEVPFSTAVTAFAGAYFLGYISIFAPAGAGVREASLAAFLVPTLGMEGSVVLAVAQRIWITAVELAGAAAGVILLRKPRLPDRETAGETPSHQA